MGSITVRCWVPAPPAVVWPRLLDLERLAVSDPGFDLETIHLDRHVGWRGDVGAGTAAVLRRRVGGRVSRLDLTVLEVAAPSSLTATLEAAGRTRWWLTIRVQELPADTGPGTDVLLQARRDGADRLQRPSLRARSAAADVQAFLAALRRGASGALPVPASRGSGHRIAVGR